MLFEIVFYHFMPLDLKHVESFVTVADTRSFSVSADRLGTVQSAVSVHIRLLEQRLGRKLVERGRGKSVDLTANGTAFLVQARRLLALADEMTSAPTKHNEDRPIRLGTTVTFALSLVPQALSALAGHASMVPVTVRTARSHELLGLLDDGDIDVALILDQGPRPTRTETVQVNLVWAAVDQFKPDAADPIPLAFLEDARDLRRHAFAALDSDKGVSTTLQTHPDPIGLRAVLAAGLAATVLPSVAVVAPFTDVGARLALPQLGKVPVSIYASAAKSPNLTMTLVECLTAKLR